MALMSASNSAYSAGKRGASGSEQLAAFGTDLVVDYALNKVAFNNLKGLRSTGSEGLERFAKNMAKQGLLSGSEGFVSEVARIASDVAVMGDRSELALYCADYMAKHPEYRYALSVVVFKKIVQGKVNNNNLILFFVLS